MKSVQTQSTVVVPAERQCPRCGARLGGFGPEGMCGACLLGSGLGEDEAAEVTEPPAPGPRRFGDYELLGEIARGGMGVVYRARQVSLNRVVALKMILGGHLAGPEEVRRFRQEAEAAAQLKHPNIVAIHEVGERDGQPFFSMDFIEGRTLRQLTRDNPLLAPRAAAYLKAIADAVHYAHERGVVHRDLKPSNVLIDAAGQPHVTDFGLAKRIGSDADLTVSGAAMGTPGYMPPEQASGGSKSVGPPADVYALGAMLYDLLTGRPPFRAETPLETMAQSVSKEPVAPRLLNASVPRDLETICLKCLEKEPARRYASALALAEDLTRYLNHEPIHASPPSAIYRARKFVRRHRVGVAVAACCVLLLTAATVVSTAFGVRATREKANTVRAQGDAITNALDARAVLDFLQNKILSAARDEGKSGGLGLDVTLRRALEKAEPQVAVLFANRPRVEAEVRGSLGITFGHLGKYDEAVRQLQRALPLAHAAFGPSDSRTINYRDNLANALVNAGRAMAALPLLRESVAWRASSEGPDHPHTLTAFSSLASALGEVGQHAEALQLCSNTLHRLEALYGRDHQRTLPTRINYGSDLLSAGRVQEAIDFLEICVPVCQSRLGAENTDTLEAINKLASAYRAAGQNEKALDLWEQIIGPLKKTKGPDHPHTLAVLDNIATVKRQIGGAGQSAESIAELVEVLKRKEETLGPDHPDTLQTMNNLAAAYQEAGNYPEALRLHESAFALRRAKHGLDDARTLESMLNLGNTYRESGNLSNAVAMLEDAYPRGQAVLGTNHHLTLTTASSLANAYRESNQYDKAIDLLQRAFDSGKSEHGEEDPGVLSLLVNLGDSISFSGRPDKAIPFLEKAVQLLKARNGVENLRTLAAMNNLATAYQTARQPTNALPIRLQTLEILLRLQGPTHRQTLNTMHGFAALRMDLGQFSDAAGLLEDIVERQSKTLPPTHPTTLDAIQKLITCYRKTDRVEKAVELGKETLNLCEDRLGPTNRHTLDAMKGLASAYRSQGELVEYPALLEKLLKRLHDVTASETVDTVRFTHYLAEARRALGQFDEAVRLHEYAFGTANKKLGSTSPPALTCGGGLAESYLAARQFPAAEEHVLRFREQSAGNAVVQAEIPGLLGEAFLGQDKFAEAAPLLRQRLDTLEKARPGGSAYHTTQFHLGSALLGQKRNADAEPLLLKAYAGLAERWVNKPSATRRVPPKDVALRLVQLYEAWGKPDEAARWCEKAK